jgi:hydrogenase/urease accessory protein HupE
MSRLWTPISVLVAALLWAAAVPAHEVGLSRGEYRLEGARVVAELVFARRELIGVVDDLDHDGDGALDEAEVASARPRLEALVLRRVAVTGDGSPCVGTLDDAALVEEDGVRLLGHFECAPSARVVQFELAALFEALPRGHRHVAFSSAGPTTVETMTFRQQSTFGIIADGGAPDAGTEAKSGETVALDFVVLGLEHIAFGIDHLAFLFGLLLLGGRLRDTLLMITAFTAAHSVTLALAALDVVALSPRIVEPLIALSVAYVGIENFVIQDASKRWRITFPFGLVHGFGFAGVLGSVGLPRDHVATSLASFNVGVELGQLAMVAAVLPVILHLRKRWWFRERGVRVLSAGVALAGVAWFVARVAGLG